jgi:hypothetical protein
LNQHWCTSLADAQQTVEDGRLDDHQVRPQSSLGYQTPQEVQQQRMRSVDGFDAAVVSA